MSQSPRTRPSRRFAPALFFALVALSAAANSSAQTAPPPGDARGLTIRYEIGMSRPVTHLYEVTMRLEGVSALSVDVQFPAWVPGSYTIIDAARNVQEFNAATAAGQPLDFAKTDTMTWRVQTRGSSSLQVNYKVYADNIGVGGAHLDDTHAFFNGPLVFAYVVGAKERPVTLTLKRPARWTNVSTGLDPLPGRPDTYAAPDYDTLADAPFEIGTHQVLAFDYKGARYEIAIYGSHNYDTARFRGELERIVRSQADMMCGVPFRRYVFIYHMLPDGRAGLEHLNSTVINRRKYAGNTEEGWDSLRGTTSHEFFHLWNVKRLRPAPLGPFDYTRQVTTRDLYVSEGMTSYYGDLHLARSGLWTPERYYKNLANEIQTLQGKPGRRILTVEESSINAWLRPDDEANTSFSYYTKGELIGFLLDMEIRRRTRNARSLDDVFLFLYRTYGLPLPGWPEGGFRRAVEQVAGSSFAEFFESYVAGTKELPYEAALGVAGLHLERKASPDIDPGFTYPTGAAPNAVGLTVSTVSSEGPAYNVLAPKDVLLAVGGERATAQTLLPQLARYREGDRVPLTVFRGDRLLELTMTAPTRRTETYAITEDPNATPAQKALRESWLKGRDVCALSAGAAAGRNLAAPKLINYTTAKPPRAAATRGPKHTPFGA